MKPTLSSFVSLCLCSSFLSLSVPARAIELSLEENRAERGSVGYVDMRRLFTASPDATRAREGLEELVRQAEERVNTKKSELLRLRGDLDLLKLERDELAKSTPTAAVVVPPPAPKPTPLPAPAPAKPMAPTPAPKPEPKAAAVAVDTTPVTAAPLTINLPGLTDGPLNLERPGSSPLNPTRTASSTTPASDGPPAVPPATEKEKEAARETPEPGPTAATTPAPAPVPVVPAGPTMAQRLLELDGRMVSMQSDIARLQGELDRERLGAERSLLAAEGRKTDQVLARLYRAISEVAKREGVSVVVDKSATLYGHPAVDLTDKVLKQLRGVIPAQ